MRLSDIHSEKVDLQKRVAARFWDKVEQYGDDECWPYTGSQKGRMGHGRFYLGRGASGAYVWTAAHRVAYMLAYGEVPDELFVCHSCDNPPCCNPRHLWVGTGKDNADDRDRKGRYISGAKPRGEQHHSNKLSISDVRAIREYIPGKGLSRPALANKYGVAQSTIDRILSRKKWGWVK